MTDTQLSLMIGIPSALFALNFLAILAAAFWQSKRFDDFEKVMVARFGAQTQMLLRVEGVLDAP